MNALNKWSYIHPTKIVSGAGCLKEIGQHAQPYGKSVMLVVDPSLQKFHANSIELIQTSLHENGVKVVVFNQVKPNPVLPDVQQGAVIAKQNAVDLMIGLGGGSTMDTARAIAVAATHPGTAMDYLYFSKTQPTEKTLPMIQIPTTSGTGSHVTCCSVITDPAKDFKSALWNQDQLFAKVALIDPELMKTVPAAITASTGFDVFTHSFESFINVNASPYTDLLAVESVRLVIENLPTAFKDGGDITARANLAWADTLAGMCIANAGTTLPHAMGQPISGHYPHVSHGQSLAVIYPAFLEYTAEAAIDKFSQVAGLFNPSLKTTDAHCAALALKDEIVKFLKEINMYYTFDDFDIPKEGIEAVLTHCMEFPDVNVNPKVPDGDAVRDLYMKSFAS